MEKTKKLGTAIIYVRVSTEEQKKKGYSIEGQEKICRGFAEGKGYEVQKVFKEEGKSAKDLNRPVLQEMFKYIKQNYKNIDVLVFWKWDRLSRGEEEDYVELNKIFKKYNIKPLSTMENNDDSPEANLMRKITFATSKYELDKDSQRTKMGMRCKAESGYYPGKAPIGYLNTRDCNDKGIIVVDEENAFYVKQAFTYYASGMYSLESLGKKMFTEGFKNKRGEVYQGRKFEEILKNIFYTGDFIWAGKRYEGTHDAIIDKKLFYTVQEVFNKTNKPRIIKHQYTYSNLITCDSCGCYLIRDGKEGANKSGDYKYYRCSNKRKKHPNLRGLSVYEEDIDNAIQDTINQIEIPENITRLLRERIIKELNTLHKTENQLLDIKTKRLKELDLLIKKSYEERLLGKMPAYYSEEVLNQQFMQWQEERDILSSDISESMNINKTIYNNIDLILDFCRRVPDIYLSSSMERKREIIQLLINKITYSHEDRTFKITLNPIFEAFRIIKKHEINCGDEIIPQIQAEVDVADYLAEHITSMINNKVRTLKTLIIANKKAPEGAIFENGAGCEGRTHAYRNHNPRP